MPCVSLFEDNQGELKIAEDPINHSKNIDVLYHFIRELVARKGVKVVYRFLPVEHYIYWMFFRSESLFRKK